MANHIRAMLGFHALGVPTVDYGNNLRQMRFGRGQCLHFRVRAGYIPPTVHAAASAVPLGGTER